jgi:sugar lactone lactonase YvrE
MMFASFARSVCAAGFAAMMTGCAVSPAPLSNGKSEMVQTAGRSTPKVKSGYVYVANSSQVGPGATGQVLIYPTTSNGNVAPSTMIGGSLTKLTQVNGIVADSTGRIFVVDSDTNEIVGFAPGVGGNVAPSITIAGSNTQLGQPVGMTIDRAGNLYVANCGTGCVSGSTPPSLLEFAAGSDGNVAPIRDITGSQTGLTAANDVALDANGDMYVVQSSSVIKFRYNANGNARPVSTLEGSKTELYDADGVAVDSVGLYAGSCSGSYIERFRANAHGNRAPISVIQGSNTMIEDCVDGIAIGGGHLIYGVTWNSAVVAFDSEAHGNVHPAAYISGPKTLLAYPTFLYVSTK